MTGRLIEADVLKKDLTRFYDNEVTAKQLIDEQPTVEAIPVEWLEDFRDGLDTLSESRLMLAVDLIIDAYRAEKKRKEE